MLGQGKGDIDCQYNFFWTNLVDALPPSGGDTGLPKNKLESIVRKKAINGIIYGLLVFICF
jgi:hypothetical protein